MKESFYYFLFFCSYLLVADVITEQKLSEMAAGLVVFTEEFYKGEMVLEKKIGSFVLISYLSKTKETA